MRTSRRCLLIWIKEFVAVGLEAEDPCVAGDWEKQKALSAVNNILSVLNRYSKLTGIVVSEKRCGNVRSIPALSSSLNLSLGRIKHSFVLTDPHLPDMPIVYASDCFLRLTGYLRHEVLGRNCRFLNGQGTCPEILEEINHCICSGRSCTVHMINYRKDGSSFCNLLHISPVRNATGKITYHVWVHLDEGSKMDFSGLSPEIWQLGAVGAVKVAVRSLSASCSLSRLPQ
uniref:Putative LOV domain-containing protein n=1 Tax=Elegia tectorum TaxID=311269 RepID=A0A126WVA6_9POAL|nr:putative LOV domain-containing protein [Elegia tectorum]